VPSTSKHSGCPSADGRAELVGARRGQRKKRLCRRGRRGKREDAEIPQSSSFSVASMLSVVQSFSLCVFASLL